MHLKFGRVWFRNSPFAPLCQRGVIPPSTKQRERGSLSSSEPPLSGHQILRHPEWSIGPRVSVIVVMNTRAADDDGGGDRVVVAVQNMLGKQEPKPNQSTIFLSIEGSWCTSFYLCLIHLIINLVTNDGSFKASRSNLSILKKKFNGSFPIFLLAVQIKGSLVKQKSYSSALSEPLR